MENKRLSSLFFALFIFLIAAILIYLSFLAIKYYGENPTKAAIEKKYKKENESFNHLQFSLMDPEEAPLKIHTLVMKGYRLMTHTREEAKEYVGNQLDCANCHFSGGNTTGGKNGGLSLAGVAATYPRYNEAYKKVLDLQGRINGCFEKSMNGKPLPLDSEEMLALVTYLHWISKGLPIYQKVPWLGISTLKTEKVPDSKKGKEIYASSCSICHGSNGEGTEGIPPIWGPQSFNKQAGMNNIDLLASFIHLNMPYEDPSLTIEEAWDVSAFLKEQSHPE